MTKNIFAKFSAIALIASFSASTVFAQKKLPAPKTTTKTAVFAVLNDGTMIEPIGFIDKNKLVEASNGSDDAAKILAFTKSYYKPNTVYKLVFGGVDAGTVTVKSNNPNSDCGKNTANVSFVSAKANLKGNVMVLATNAAIKKGTGVRRLPTAAERAEIESLVRAEFVKNKVAASAAKNLRYQNLTALDVDADGKAEMVGSFWVEPSADERALLFFIADKGANGKYAFGYSDFSQIKKSEMMEGSEMQMVDSGVFHELLLDAMNYDGDKTDEIFTYTQTLEGASFNAYSRRAGKWTKAFKFSNYHCGF